MSQTLLLDPKNKNLNDKLHFNKTVVAAKPNKFQEFISEWNKAINFDGNYLKAIWRRAASYMELEEF